jgi:hypothetical protein
MTEASIEPFAQAHLDGLIALVTAEGWTEYTDDVERTYRALTAPGVTTLVARECPAFCVGMTQKERHAFNN